MLERSLKKDKVFGAFQRHLDCLDYELLTAKLNGYGFSLPALRFIIDQKDQIYLSNRKQKTKIENTSSTWLDDDYLSEWFKDNLLKSKADKCHLLVSTNNRASINAAGC